MTLLFHINYVGDSQGTALVCALKKIANDMFGASVCTEEAIDGICEYLRGKRDELSALHPKWKYVRVSLDRFQGLQKLIWRIDLVDPSNGTKYSMLSLSRVRNYYLPSDGSLLDLADDNACEEIAHNLSVYNI